MSNRLGQLAINTEGFVFDPSTGESFTANQTGVAGLNGLRVGKSIQEIAKELTDEFEVSFEEAERDITDFVTLLQAHRLL